MIWFVTVAQQRYKFTVIAADGSRYFSVRVGRIDDRGIVVESSQSAFEIPFYKRSIRRRPIRSCAGIAEQMKRCPAQWVTAIKRPFARCIDRDVDRCVILSRLRCNTGIAGCQGQTGLVIYRAAGNESSDVEDALVVLESPPTVRLDAQVEFDHHFIGGDKLNIEQHD